MVIEQKLTKRLKNQFAFVQIINGFSFLQRPPVEKNGKKQRSLEVSIKKVQ